MIAPLLIGLVAGARSMTPFALVSALARRGALPNGGPVSTFLASGWISAASMILAVGELVGDKMRSAPDRIVVPGLAARLLTGGLAGAALVPRRHQSAAALIGATAAIASSYATFHTRSRAMRRYGQRTTGMVEDVLVIGFALWIANRAREPDFLDPGD